MDSTPAIQQERQPSTVLPVLKAFIILCVIVAVLLPWGWPGYGGFIGIILALLAILCSVVTLFFKAFAFGIIMVFVSMFAGGVSVTGLVHHTYRIVKVTMQMDDILTKQDAEIQTAKLADDRAKVTELRLHQVEALKQFYHHPDTLDLLPESDILKLNHIFTLSAAYAAAEKAGNEAEAAAKATELDAKLNELFHRHHHPSSPHGDADPATDLWDLLD